MTAKDALKAKVEASDAANIRNAYLCDEIGISETLARTMSVGIRIGLELAAEAVKAQREPRGVTDWGKGFNAGIDCALDKIRTHLTDTQKEPRDE